MSMVNMKTDGSIEAPTSIRLDICSLCQLQCPLCPGTQGENESIVGRGYLPFGTFKGFIDSHPYIRRVELANQGEVFLNKDLPQILEYAHTRNVITAINGGVNLNHATDEALEALVKFETVVVRCAIDGVTQETYAAYRVGGNLKNVLANIQKINAYKEKYQSPKPHLILQFIVFGHNEHEMKKAILLSKMLKMNIAFRLNRIPDLLPVKNRRRVRKIIGYADREEYLWKRRRSYLRSACLTLWKNPQVNWDGKLLGCRCNKWRVYAENVFKDDLMACLNNKRMRYARQMLMGNAPPRDDIPCTSCEFYTNIRKYCNWITQTEIRTHTLLEHTGIDMVET